MHTPHIIRGLSSDGPVTEAEGLGCCECGAVVLYRWIRGYAEAMVAFWTLGGGPEMKHARAKARESIRNAS